jgi:CheY-like chemotaxis protein
MPTKVEAMPKGPAFNKAEAITILLVDDDEDCRFLIREAISECKIVNRVYEVPDGKTALDFVFQRGEFEHAPRPGLIYLDIEMPGMNGQEVLRIIKSTPQLRDIPVVMMTGVCDENQMERAAQNGANSYTLKPANAEQFLRTVLDSTNYWMKIHQYPDHHLPSDACRR